MLPKRAKSLTIAFVLASSAAACAIVPKDGPEGVAIVSGATATATDTNVKVDYALVDLTPAAVEASKAYSSAFMRRFSDFRGRGGGGDVSIGIGDIVSVTIFESESGGLFIPKDAASRPGNDIQIPNQQVDTSGDIVIPYVNGPIHVAGRSTRDVANEITSKLSARAIEPQTVVSVVEHRGNDVSVLGEVMTAARFSLDPGGIRLSGAIARAGGPKNPAYETLVTVKRGNRVQTAELTAILKDPSQDIGIMPGDVISLSHEPKVFMVLGATPSPGAIGGVNNRRFSFDNESMTLAEGISKAGGLDSTRASPGDFYLLRFEKPAMLKALGVDVSRFGAKLVPTVYKVDLSAADGFFLASRFDMRDQDVIFVAEAALVDIGKVLTIAEGASATSYNFSQGAK